MARLRFRITTITLDEEEGVAGVTAVVRDDTLNVIRGIIGENHPTVTHIGRGGTELSITLPVNALLDLFYVCGQTLSADARHEHTREIFDSLSLVAYDLMGN